MNFFVLSLILPPNVGGTRVSRLQKYANKEKNNTFFRVFYKNNVFNKGKTMEKLYHICAIIMMTL